MFGKRKPTSLEIVTDRAVRELEDYTIGSPEYAKGLDIAIQLHRMREEEKSHQVSRNTLILVAANLLGILMVIRHEHVNVITSRAMGMVIKPRVEP